MRSFYAVSYVSQDGPKFCSRLLGIYPTREQAFRDACVLFFARNGDTPELLSSIEKAKEDLKTPRQNYEEVFTSLQKELYRLSRSREGDADYIPKHCWISISRGVQEYPDQVVSMAEVSLTRESFEKELLTNPY